jgi:hypothetical protein
MGNIETLFMVSSSKNIFNPLAIVTYSYPPIFLKFSEKSREISLSYL